MSQYQTALAPADKAAMVANRAKAFETIASKVTIQEDASARWAKSAVVDRNDLRTAVKVLRDELEFDQLIDVVGIDYLNYPGHRGPRFAVAYLFKSQKQSGLRFQLKVLVEEDDISVPSIHDFYAIADWAEREVFDQYGVIFTGHPNLKRLLNHFEFVGHPLRKDYPAQKRQWLSTNDPMLDQLAQRLEHNGFQLLDPVPVNTPAVEDLIKGERT